MMREDSISGMVTLAAAVIVRRRRPPRSRLAANVLVSVCPASLLHALVAWAGMAVMNRRSWFAA